MSPSCVHVGGMIVNPNHGPARIPGEAAFDQGNSVVSTSQIIHLLAPAELATSIFADQKFIHVSDGVSMHSTSVTTSHLIISGTTISPQVPPRDSAPSPTQIPRSPKGRNPAPPHPVAQCTRGPNHELLIWTGSGCGRTINHMYSFNLDRFKRLDHWSEPSRALPEAQGSRDSFNESPFQCFRKHDNETWSTGYRLRKSSFSTKLACGVCDYKRVVGNAAALPLRWQIGQGTSVFLPQAHMV